MAPKQVIVDIENKNEVVFMARVPQEKRNGTLLIGKQSGGSRIRKMGLIKKAL